MKISATRKMSMVIPMILATNMIMGMIVVVVGADTNDVFSPCSDSQVSRGDGFSFGLVFSTRESFFLNGVQLSPCDTRLPLAGTSAELATFRPKVDELSLLTINNSQFNPVCIHYVVFF